MKITPIPPEPLTDEEARLVIEFLNMQPMHIYEKYAYNNDDKILYRSEYISRKELAKILKAQRSN